MRHSSEPCMSVCLCVLTLAGLCLSAKIHPRTLEAVQCNGSTLQKLPSLRVAKTPLFDMPGRVEALV